MRAIPWLLLVLAGGLSASAGTVVPKPTRVTPESVAAPAPVDPLLAPADPDFVVDMIGRNPEVVIQLGPVPRDDCFRGNLIFGDSASGPIGSTPCP
jgi:hypothetical protein